MSLILFRLNFVWVGGILFLNKTLLFAETTDEV